MLHRAGVDVSLLRNEGQSRNPVEGAVAVVVITEVGHPFGHLHVILPPCEVEGGRVEMTGQAEERVQHPVLPLIAGVDGGAWRF